MLLNNQTKRLDLHLLPAVEEAVELYESHGGHLTLLSEFGEDPLSSRNDLLQLREARFFECYPSFDEIFHGVVNNDKTLFREGILHLIDVSMQLTAHL